MSDQLYREEILDHYQHPRNCQKPKTYSRFFSLSNVSCGDKITVYLQLEKEKIKQISYQISGCAISVASASILSQKLKNKTRSQVLKLTSLEVLKLLKLQLTPTRAKCALLPVEAIKKSLL
ncbi:hypothetical protein A2313_04155 [Candidatus Roizmanbacteria bacterium RIFOXYB2_FULL_41_10]|uniref:NIF system FeS cluster assembly NifU N-terminal domain-containing protein n=1 Tax=Candidatus Roizmanbacteria bacterium RIFOXYA1_FULL_41_12 TaxID=1802082 RepID=A0A1F7KEY4_9BACT|nr:MAG: hypothetical protein A2209_01560 [Candidatus Roizmanbacteria bacterium RIFOXYA1_FULL_41_12]OGK68138.1 MAG: hypothetical protein A2377_04220 [Candidatus Roizmanbacteria bacterium RIFOXYB1_FULL_41_27]OGK68578.1 MAG: hypothetical protein A2262_02175 [Candidatus Roizmanbacteria bacterium RIFOXYA2_FULL_41_8]OGK69279.1 MAG: hypothetical protein A2313_04155 [Candidatus Roizmanbacteria bacterium RIFOXYB2_FULL_41_10]OGK71924.1 MAG: hypothetical protein A2403_03140 [Candidatus Roizmanbacteria bac